MKDYRKPGPTEAAWESISKALGANSKFIIVTNTMLSYFHSFLPAEDLKKRWKSLRDTFIKYYRMEIEQCSPLNTRQKVWKYYNNLNYLRNHVELYRLDEATERVGGNKSVSNDDQSLDQPEYETTSNQQMIRHDYNSTSIKSKTNTFKVLVEAEGTDPYKTAEYTLYETNQDGELDELETGNNDQIYLEPIEAEEYQIDNEPMEPPPKKDQSKKHEVITQMSNDPDEKFLQSCLPVLKRVTAQKNALLKLKIQTLLYEIEFGSADDSPEPKKRRF